MLRDIDLTVEAGELTAVLGSSGSGKTTLLRVLAGFEHIEAGEIRLGHDVVASARSHVNPEQRGITVVPQDHALFPHMTVGANIGYGVARKVRKQRIKEMVALTGLGGLETRMPQELSGGQQQRVAIARALAPCPAVVLLDEPFSGLDANLRATMREEISAMLRASGTTTVLVTHDQEEALSIADRVAVLRDGKVVQAATPSDLYSSPVDADIANFVGDANLLPGTVTGGVLTCALGAFPVQSAEGEVTALFRPEHVAITETEGVEARVTERLYYGHDGVVLATLASGETVRIRVHGSMSIPERDTPVRLSAQGTPNCYTS